jgi:signal transduction histidine kinase
MTITISCAVTILLEFFITWYYCVKIFAPKYSHTAFSWCAAALYVLLFVITLRESVVTNLVSFLLVNLFLIWQFFQIEWYSALFHAFLLTIVMTTTEVLVTILVPNQVYQFYDNASVQGLIFIVFTSKLLYFLIIRCFSVLICSRQQKTLSLRETVSLCLVPACSTVLSITLTMVSFTLLLPRHVRILVSLSLFCILIINVVVGEYYSYSQKRHHELTTLQLQLQKETDALEYYQLLLKHEEDKSILIHDIKKHLHSIYSLLSQHSSQLASDYITQLLQSAALQSSIRVCNHDTINAIFSRYESICKERQIRLEADIRNNTLAFMSDSDITALLCNLLDNALEAARTYPGGFIFCTIQKREYTPYVIITMENSCRNAPISSGDMFLSHKKNSNFHGFGLKSIVRIAQKYSGHAKFYYREEDHTFHSIITVHSDKACATQ